MKVKIIKCNRKTWWYGSVVGKEVEVTPNEHKDYYVVSDEENKKYNTTSEIVNGYVCTIDKSDCEII